MGEEFKTSELQWRHFYTVLTVDRKYFLNSKMNPFYLTQKVELAVSQITTMIAGERIKEISYPLDWWQAFKERWYPAFLLKKFPVTYHRWKIDFLYPEMELRKGFKPEIAIYDSRRSRGYPHFEDTQMEEE